VDQQSLQIGVLRRSSLVSLTIRDVVLIDRLTLGFRAGLTALTGETGAGKSILLDSLGLALGARGESGLTRVGAERALVVAEFELPDGHAVLSLLKDHGLDADERLIVRRSVTPDGRSRAWVNDQPVGVGVLRAIGDALAEVHGQFDTHGLLDPGTHRGLLDAFAGVGLHASEVAAAHRAWRNAERERDEARTAGDKARAEEDFLRAAVEEIEKLAPKPGEERELAETRSVLQHREKVMEAMNAAFAELGGERGAQRLIGSAARALTRAAEKAGGRLDGAIAALDRAQAEIEEATSALQGASSDLDMDPRALETLEERLFALRAAARKHGVDVDKLAALRDDFAAKLALIDDQGDAAQRLEREATRAKAAFTTAASRLSAIRADAAVRLDRAVAGELVPLKMERARFHTTIERLNEGDWGPTGFDRVVFQVATNPGAAPGPLNKIASGGELARFMLALRVVLAGAGAVGTLIFDEVDTGIGGAVAAAVGERLARLGRDAQVLVVTHSPQVAARGDTHLKVMKSTDGETTTTTVVDLDGEARREEIARMLSGAVVTDEARAAAESLIAGRGQA